MKITNGYVRCIAAAGLIVVPTGIFGQISFTDLIANNTFLSDGSTTLEGDVFVTGNNGVVFGGTYDQGSKLMSDNEHGVRFLWYPKKAAFRAGRVTGTQWNDTNIGDYSVAFGRNSRASGYGSMATGEGAIASGSYSFAMGEYSVAAGSRSVAMGNAETYAGGSGAVSLGNGNYVSGTASFAAGDWNEIYSGPRSVALGSGNYLEAMNDSIAIGTWNHVNASHSLAFGRSNQISSSYSKAFGQSNHTMANQSIAVGMNLTPRSYGMLAVGRFNVWDVGVSSSSWVETDPLFVIGNGTSSSNRSNAMTVYKNGDVEMTEGEVTIARIPAQGGILMGDFGTPP